jgi:hypothetical protein
MNKEQARSRAIEIQSYISEKENISYGDLFLLQEELYKLGKRFGLIREFKENGLI